MSNENNWRAAIDTAVRLYGKLNILVNLVSDTNHTSEYLDNSFSDEKLCAQRLKKIHAQ
jgi:S-adenosylhomocysteine hydrolase